MRSTCKPLAVILFAACIYGGSGCINLQAQESTAVQSAVNMDSAEAVKHYQYFDCLAKAFAAKLATGEALQLVKEPLLKWTIDSTWHGSFYIWTCKNRPALIGCFLTDSRRQDRRQAYIEMHSMADEPFTPMAFSGLREYQWNPTLSKKSVLSVAGLQQPVVGARQKRTQMRQIADTFAVTMYEDAEKGNGKEQLRMLTTPLYRYPETGEDGLTGAIYAFVTTNGTDPEFLLAIEHDPKSKRGGWQIRPIRFATRRLELHHQNAVVWEVEEYNMSLSDSKLTDPYMIITLLETDTNSYNAIRDHMIGR